MSGDARRIKKLLYRHLLKSYRGWWYWHWIDKRRTVDGTTAVLLFPSVNQKDEYYALLHLDEMMPTRGFNKAIILTVDPVVAKVAPLFSKNIRETLCITRKKAECLMQYACLFTFDLRFIIASIDEPVGRKGETLVGKRGITREEVFCVGVYRVYPQKKAGPVYKGSDVEVRRFLKAGVKGR